MRFLPPRLGCGGELRVLEQAEPHNPTGIAVHLIVRGLAPFAVLDKALADTGHLVGGRFTVADLNLAEVARYATAAGELFDAAPRVKAWLAACQARPAFKAMWVRRDAEPA